MRRDVRFGLMVMLGLVLLAAPSVGLAGGPAGPKGGQSIRSADGPTLKLPDGVTVAAPATVPGAAIGTVGSMDGVVFSSVSGGTVVAAAGTGNTLYFYNSTGNDMAASLRLPAGATLWQVDVYGYTTGSAAQTWALFDEDSTNGDSYVTTGAASTSTGPGLVQGVMSFPIGLTLAMGHNFQVDLYPSSSSSGYVGAVFQYTLPTLSLVPIAPTRVYDSRLSGGPLSGGSSRTISVATATGGGTAVPAGAKAVAYNLTVTGTASAGWLALVPHGSAFGGTSSINWFGASQDLANGGVVSLGGDRQVDVYAGGATGASTQFIVDITGYYR